jgi:hypothetical protein
VKSAQHPFPREKKNSSSDTLKTNKRKKKDFLKGKAAPLLPLQNPGCILDLMGEA